MGRHRRLLSRAVTLPGCFLDDPGGERSPRGETKTEEVGVGPGCSFPFFPSCPVLALSVRRDPGCPVAWTSPCSPQSVFGPPAGCVACAPCSPTLRGSPWWPAPASPSTSRPRSPSLGPACKCSTACTTRQTVSVGRSGGGGDPTAPAAPPCFLALSGSTERLV